MKVKAYWYKRKDYTNTVANVGDMLTPIILESLTGCKIKWSRGTRRILACGSIIENIHYGDIVWGSGLIAPMKLNKKERVKILAVRGELTRKYLVSSGYECPQIYGDPSLLMPTIYDNKKEKKYDIGFVPHYVEKKEFREWFGGHQISIINNPLMFIDQIRECRSIITSSLHAYILARAYGINAEYVQLTDRIIGGMFKYYDFLGGKKYYDQDKFINALKDEIKPE